MNVIEKDCIEKTHRDKQKLLIVQPAESKSARLRKLREKLVHKKEPELELEKLLAEHKDEEDADDESSDSNIDNNTPTAQN